MGDAHRDGETRPDPKGKGNPMTRQEILELAMRQSATDCSCRPEDFRRKDNVIVESKAAEGTSRYMKLPHICALFTYGNNVVAACRKDLIPEITEYVNGAEKIHRCFETPTLYRLNKILEKVNARVAWMHTCFLPDLDRIYGAELRCPYETRLLHQEDFRDLYVPEWGNALCSDRKELDMLGVGAYDEGRLVGLAACSADCPEMWQIGIDVLPEYRQKGIASALTNQLARAIFDAGKLPFYAAAWANVRSFRNGIKSGFVPAWSALTAIEIKEDPE